MTSPQQTSCTPSGRRSATGSRRQTWTASASRSVSPDRRSELRERLNHLNLAILHCVVVGDQQRRKELGRERRRVEDALFSSADRRATTLCG